MKQLILLLTKLLAACSTQKLAKKHPPEISGKDSTEYELLVFDPEFESWYAIHNSDVQAKSKEYYHSWNIQYVNEWNYRVTTSRHSGLYGQPINYDANADYPFEIEHKLFYYFQYVQHVLHIPLLRNGPHVF